jgi:hypothetical protein
MKKLFALFLLVFVTTLVVNLQSYGQNKTEDLFGGKKEIYFKFNIYDRSEIEAITRIISIDNVKGREVWAYANRQEYEKFSSLGYEITLLPSPGSLLSDAELMKPAGSQTPSAPGTWNFYPTYQQYVDTMVYFSNTYPSICKLDTIGTTVDGRLLLVMKISKDVNTDGAKPQFFYTSTIHGDEVTGYVGMLHLIEYLLTNYGSVPRITNIVDSIELFINPLANPDGTYAGGNNSVSGATYNNANNVNLNRNFPDPVYGPHPDGYAWQPETVAFMNFAGSKNLTMSANFHGGAEVFNYPWDDKAALAADDSWWKFVGHEFADTCHHYGPSGYFTDITPSGITNGYAWYQVTGGRQDYHNYFHHDREVTIEISAIKMPPANQMVLYWNYLYRSYLNFIEQSLYGIHGIVTDTATAQPLRAFIYITGHDKDSSQIYSRLPSGYYDRVIDQGSWNLTFTSPGYYTKTISNINVAHYQGVHLDVQLKSLTYGTSDLNHGGLTVYPSPANNDIHIVFPEIDSKRWKLEVMNTMGTCVCSSEINNTSGLTHILNVSSLANGMYFIVLSNENGIYRRQIIVRH